MKKFPAAVPDRPIKMRQLKNPKEAMLYLNAAVQVALEEDDPELILLAVYDVAQAQGIKKVANSAKMHRVSLHRMLNKGGNPEWKSIFKVLSALQMTFKFERAYSKAA